MGQELGATALQMAAATNVIASGGKWYRPRIVREIFRQTAPRGSALETTVQAAGTVERPHLPPEGHRVISAETALHVRKMMEEVVLSGTGTQAHLRGYTSAGKTGTAQKYDPNTGTYSKTDYVGSFIGFAPVNNPIITIAVILDSAVGLHQGGQVSAPLFKRIAEKVLAHMEVPPELPTAPERVAKVDPSQVSDFAEEPAQETAPRSKPSLSSKEAPVKGTAVLDLEGAVKAPDFLGKTVRAVAQEAMSKGWEVEIVGSGIAREQIPPPGGSLPPGRKITVKFAR